MTTNALTIAILAVTVAVPLKAQSTRDQTQDEITSVPLVPVVFGGNRYVVDADFGLEKKVPLMVHGNANLYLMITHEIAEQLNDGKPIKKTRDYGYSEKGSGSITVAKFQIGNKSYHNSENTRVFDWPASEGKAAQGMLGTGFLEKERAGIDFDREELQIGVPASDEPCTELADQGYSFTRFEMKDGEAYMEVYFDALKKEIPITVGTVGSECILDATTFKDAIDLEATERTATSPSNTSTPIYRNVAPIKFMIARQSFEIPAKSVELYSLADYGNVPQTSLFPFGIIGRDWMKENKAIIDYGNKILYFKPSTGRDKE